MPSQFNPAWWLNNTHLQTLYPTLCRRKPVLDRQRERITLNDGDFVDLDWCYTADDNAPLVIILHGLSGSSSSTYVLGMQHALKAIGWSSAALNFRGCSGEFNLKARAYHSGDTGDIEQVYQHIRKLHPRTDLYAIGFSLGGNVLLKWMAEQGENSGLKAAVAVSVPYLLGECATQLDQGFAKVYRAYLLNPLKRMITQKAQFLTQQGLDQEAQKLYALGDLKKVTSFWQYDDQVVATLHGFKSAQDYYEQSSSQDKLHAIRSKTLLIHSIDDPFMTKNVTPKPSQCSDTTELELVTCGGHVGFVSGTNPFNPQFWIEQRALAFFASSQ